MGRIPRDYSEGSIYHVFQRGNNREFLFESDECKGMMIHNFKEFRVKFDYEILGFVIMDNHYHFIIKLNKDPLDVIMFNINNVYAKYVNRILERSGHVFESRYKCKKVENESYLLWLLRYIHRNPLRAKLVINLDDYFWSSHFLYRNGNNETINTNLILNLIAKKKAKAILGYMRYMTLLGDDENQQRDFKILSNLLDKKLENDDLYIKNDKKGSIRESLESIGDRVLKDAEVKKLILSGSKKRYLTPFKIEFIQEAKSLKYTLKEIGKYLCCAESGISCLMSRSNKNMMS